MATSPTPSRPWRDIAKELTKESDPKHVAELTQELNQAMTERLQEQNPEKPSTQPLSV